MASPNTPITSTPTYGSDQPGAIGIIQNLGTVPLFVLFGAGCSTTNFTFILAAGAVASDGTGGTFTWNFYLGPVSVAVASGSAAYIMSYNAQQGQTS